jgi:uncharacterized membrane protein
MAAMSIWRRIVRAFQTGQLPLAREDGISAMFAAVFIGLVLAPLLAFAIEIGRYAETRTLIQQAADLAALAAAQEADLPAFEQAGTEVLLPTAQNVAQNYIDQNTTRATAQHISVTVHGITVSQNITTCAVDADVSELFPKFVGHVTIHVTGTAEFRFTQNGQYAP